MQHFTQPIPLSLYIHLPWCVRKCPYCDFNSHESKIALPEELYVKALIADLDEHLPSLWGRRLTSIFFGGGTPSLFSEKSVATILQEVRARFNYLSSLEITLEANPGTLDEKRFAGFLDAGVNRLSLGVQSFDDEKLKVLGRIHNGDAAKRAIKAAQAIGFNNINIDLMHGLPNQTTSYACTDLEEAFTFNPQHVSWYQLTMEPNTIFYKKPPTLPDDEQLWEIQQAGKEKLAQQGYIKYEVSAYARDEKKSLHNVNYWQFGDYLGIGAGAHSKITHPSEGIISRHWQMKQPTDYLNREKSFTAERKILTSNETIFEFMLNALRLNSGFSETLFTERTGLPFNQIEKTLAIAIDKKLIQKIETSYIPTELGQRFLNDLVSLFL